MGLAVMEASGLCATIFEFVGQAAASPSTPLVPSTEGVTAFDGDVVGIVEGVQNQTAPSPVMIAKEDGEKSDTVSGGDGGTRVAFQHRPGIFRDDAVKLRGVDCSRGPRSHQQLAEGQMMLALVESKVRRWNYSATTYVKLSTFHVCKRPNFAFIPSNHLERPLLVDIDLTIRPRRVSTCTNDAESLLVVSIL